MLYKELNGLKVLSEILTLIRTCVCVGGGGVKYCKRVITFLKCITPHRSIVKNFVKLFEEVTDCCELRVDVTLSKLPSESKE